MDNTASGLTQRKTPGALICEEHATLNTADHAKAGLRLRKWMDNMGE